MAIVIGKLKCYFCGIKDGVMESVCDYGIYGEVGGRIHYHMECLQMIEVSPEKYGNIMADKAIHINDLRRNNMRNCNNELEDNFKKKVAQLFRDNFERMLPSKRRA